VRTRVALVVAGLLAIGYGVVGTLATPGSRPVAELLFLAALVVGHDALLMPLALLAGALIARFTPVPARAAVRLAALVSLAVLVVALPPLLSGGRPDDPSALPLPYGRGLAVLLVLAWGAALTAVAIRKLAERSSRAGER